MPIKNCKYNRLSFNCDQLIFLCLILITNVSCDINCKIYNSSAINSCNICLSSTNFHNCTINNVSLSQQKCVNECCRSQFSSNSSYLCLKNKQTNQNDTSNSSNRIAIVLTVIFFSVPVTVCICAILVNCIRRQREHRRRNETPPISAINLRDFDIDDIGPYYLETSQVCSICLEQKCMIRTKCGHIYHPDCLKAWIKKKETCPFCVSQDINPIKVYCNICLKSVKLSLLSMHMEQQLQQQWEQLAEIKCETCQGIKNNQQNQISLQQSQKAEKKNEYDDERLKESISQINKIQQNQKSEILNA